MDVNQEKKVSYKAYWGLENLAKDVCVAVNNPVFKVVGEAAEVGIFRGFLFLHVETRLLCILI